MKFCKDCKHYVPQYQSDFFFGIEVGKSETQFPKCAKFLEPVKGEPENHCSTARSLSRLCGPEGQFWEAK